MGLFESGRFEMGWFFCLRWSDFCLKKGVAFLFERVYFCPRDRDFFVREGVIFVRKSVREDVIFV